MQDNTFEIRLEIADMMWEVDRLNKVAPRIIEASPRRVSNWKNSTTREI